MSEVACLNGHFCVDTLSDLEKNDEPIDNVKLMQQASQLKWDPVVLYMSLLVHLPPPVSWIAICGRLGSAVQFHSAGPRHYRAKSLLFTRHSLSFPSADWSASGPAA